MFVVDDVEETIELEDRGRRRRKRYGWRKSISLRKLLQDMKIESRLD